jgi:serine protease AprX
MSAGPKRDIVSGFGRACAALQAEVIVSNPRKSNRFRARCAAVCWTAVALHRALSSADPLQMSRRAFLFACAVLATVASVARANDQPADGKLDAALWSRAQAASRVHDSAFSRVIVRTSTGKPATSLIAAAGGRQGRFFPWLGGQVALVPNAALEWLASQPEISAISLDRAVRGTTDRTAVTIGARWVNEQFGVDGAGVGVATIDSGVNAFHDDLDGRVVHFADFVNGGTTAYDDYGHGTHVAGIIAGSGMDSGGERRGIAPGAHLVVLKALDVTGNGYTSNVIAAIDYAIANRATYNIRVLNLSVAAGVYESFWKDPLTLAAKRAVDAGIVVIAAAGNQGRGPAGRAQYGGIASPGNAPWVLTVGAAYDLGTVDRRDDVVAGFSARGPAAIDGTAKPDLIAPGVGIESTTDPGSALYASNPRGRIWGSVPTATEPYLSLTGTSMAAPVVTGVVALMLQVNPTLTPNAVKAILEYTAETRAGYDFLTQGAGFLNARGAVELARAFGGSTISDTTDAARWSRHVIWGNLRIGGGAIGPRAKAWRLGVTWGTLPSTGNDPAVTTTACAGDDACGITSWDVPCDVVTATCEPAFWSVIRKDLFVDQRDERPKALEGTRR